MKTIPGTELQPLETPLEGAATFLYDNRKNIVSGVTSLILPFLVFCFLCRTIFAPDDTVNVDTLFLDILARFGNEKWNTDYLMWTIQNFSKVQSWDWGVFDMVKILPLLFSVFLFITALILQAFELIVFFFDLLFISGSVGVI